MGEFDGKVAVITGAANGMGEAVAHQLAARGATVVIADKDTERSALVEAEVKEAGGAAYSIVTDVREEEQVRGLMSEVVARFGRIDVLDNNAAALELVAEDPDVVNLSTDILDRTMRGNLYSMVWGCKYAIPQMIANGGGSIVNMSSVAALTGDLVLSAYAMSKAAVIALTRQVATQYGKQGIRCNAVAPGTVLTRNVESFMPDDYRATYIANSLTPHLGTPDDVASLVVYLAGAGARYMTGHTIPVDGGIVAGLGVVSDRRGQLGML